jgi:hypothetical protein
MELNEQTFAGLLLLAGGLDLDVVLELSFKGAVTVEHIGLHGDLNGGDGLRWG